MLRSARALARKGEAQGFASQNLLAVPRARDGLGSSDTLLGKPPGDTYMMVV